MIDHRSAVHPDLVHLIAHAPSRPLVQERDTVRHALVCVLILVLTALLFKPVWHDPARGAERSLEQPAR